VKLSGTRNQCTGCKEYFNSNTAFDKHRTGKHGVNRRCRTPEEMQNLGMFINIYGYWVSEPMVKDFYAKTDTV
jgi:hypothetical protein